MVSIKGAINYTTVYINSFLAKNRMINQRSKEALYVAENERNKLKDDIQSIVDTLAALNNLGVVDKETRPTLITALANAKDGSTKKLIEAKS